MGEQIRILVALANERMLLGQRVCVNEVTTAITAATTTVMAIVCALFHGHHGVGKQTLGQGLDVLVAVDPLRQGLGAGAINAPGRVAFGQTHDAPELSLAHPALGRKHQLAQSAGVLANRFGLAQYQARLARG